jgi:hypothetical protein
MTPRILQIALVTILAAGSVYAADAPKASDVAAALEPFLQTVTPSRDDEGLPWQSVIGTLTAAKITGKKSDAQSQTGKLESADAMIDYKLDVSPGPMKFEVTATLNYTGKPDALVGSLGIRVPFKFGANARRVKLTAGNDSRPRPETWWVDQNDQWHVYWMLSDQSERWPLWRIGGIWQDSPEHYVIWKSNRADTSPLVVDRGKKCPGWIDVSDTDHGVTVLWEEMSSRAPTAVTVDHPSNAIDILFHPPMSGARAAKDAGLVPGKPLVFKFTLWYHDEVFPAMQKQELPREVYTEFLRLIDEQGLWQYVAYNYLVPMEGDQKIREDRAKEYGHPITEKNLDVRIRQAIDTGVQPSELLLYFDTGNTWKMQKLCAAIKAPYSAKDHEANVKAVLDFCAKRAEDRKAGKPVEPTPAK